MYGWILDGISSLFEHVTENNPIVWPGKGNVSEGVHTRPGVKAGSGQQENHARPAKRKCQRSVVGVILVYTCASCGFASKITLKRWIQCKFQWSQNRSANASSQLA